MAAFLEDSHSHPEGLPPAQPGASPHLPMVLPAAKLNDEVGPQS